MQSVSLFPFLYGQSIAIEKGLMSGPDSFSNDEFIIDHAVNYTNTPLPNHLVLMDSRAQISASPRWPRTIKASDISIGDSKDYSRSELFTIETIECRNITLILPSSFPKCIRADTIDVSIGGYSDISLKSCSIYLRDGSPKAHLKFILELEELSACASFNLPVEIDGLPLHEWADRPECKKFWKGLAKDQPEVLTKFFDLYEKNFSKGKMLDDPSDQTQIEVVQTRVIMA